MAAIIHDVLKQSLRSGAASDTTTGLRDAFQETLVPDPTDDQFADMLAQTIAYGLFAARVQHAGDSEFTRMTAASAVPKTNPFLRGLFTHVTSGTLDDEPYAGVVDDIAQLLNDTDIARVLRNFGQDRRDPIVHFYETFLSAYNPELRDVRGVYYTPLPVVDFIVDSVDQVLRTTFGLEDGLGDTTRTSSGEHQVLVLDPATGTGTFLYSAISKIRQTFIDHGRTSLWSSYVSEHVLPRFFGFELMVARTRSRTSSLHCSSPGGTYPRRCARTSPTTSRRTSASGSSSPTRLTPARRTRR
jgi:predicted helicase